MSGYKDALERGGDTRKRPCAGCDDIYACAIKEAKSLANTTGGKGYPNICSFALNSTTITLTEISAA